MLGDSVRRRNKPVRAGREKPPAPDDGRRRLRWKVWAPILAGAAALPFLIGYALAVWVLFPPPEVVGEGIAVPALRGQPQAQARQLLAAAGLGGLEVTLLPHPDLPEGTVIAQSPLAGQQLRAGASVRVALSSGVPRVIVPDVVGFGIERASGFLERLGFDVGREEVESTVTAGRVLSIDPGPGSQVALPATVRLTISAGPPALPDTGAVPIDTTGTPIDTTGIRTDTSAVAGTSARGAR